MNDITETFDLPIVKNFDKLCFEFGDRDAILSHGTDPVSYFEIQEHSKALAHQLYYRFGRPDYILLDCQELPVAEAVATLACMRINRPFVPVSSMDQHRPGRMNTVVDLLSEKGEIYASSGCEKGKEGSKRKTSCHSPSIVAVVVCENDREPLLSVFQQAEVHRILYLCPHGTIRECLSVPETLPFDFSNTSRSHDDMYVMFTSGTTSASESGSTSQPKAVVGSHRATYARLSWFLATFASSPRIGRRTKLTFVDGVTELWGALLDPMNVLVSVPSMQLRARGVAALVEDMMCTQLLLLPSQATQLLLASSTNDLHLDLERVIVSGEVCSPVLLERLQTRHPKTQVINLYGQTETTGDCLCAVLTEMGEEAIVENVVAVGKPIVPGVQISLLDADENVNILDNQKEKIENKQLVIKGSQLSNGYLGSSLSFDQFRPGDIGFHRNGIWYVRGRTDDVRKVNGILTSPSEVEAAFCKTYQISDCAGVVAVLVDDQMHLLCTNQEAVNHFSRLHMNNSEGIPLNLVPKRVFYVHKIPRSTSGAKKIDRNACLKLVESHIGRAKGKLERIELGTSNAHSKRKSEGNVLSIIANVLGVNGCELDENKSFLEMGGDSASSITLLYRLRQEMDHLSDLNATDILWSKTLLELENMIAGKVDMPKRSKREADKKKSTPEYLKKFVAENAFQVDTRHRSISLRACVDSTPLVVGNSLVTACQGGVIMKFSAADGTVEGSRHYPGWMFQADSLPLGSNNLLLCGHSLSEKGIVICLTNDLREEKWKTELDGSIKSRPIVLGDKVWILADKKLCSLDIASGQVQSNGFELPRAPCVSNPIVIDTEEGKKSIGFASSDWEGGIVLMTPQHLKSKIYVDCEVGPVHKDMTMTNDALGVLMSDIYGSLHVLTIKTMTIAASIQLSSNPLSAATMMNETTIIVGSYNGRVYCVKYDEKQRLLEKQWECNCHSSIYSKPLILKDGSTVVCTTTSGNVVKISIETGELLDLYNISAEIWSSPVQVGRTNVVAVGARDSKCHLLSLEDN